MALDQLNVSVLRPDDLLNLDVGCVNLRFDPGVDGADPILSIDDEAQEALLIVRFPPQTIVEEAFFDDSKDPNTGNAPKPQTGLTTAEQQRQSLTPAGVLRSPGSARSRMAGESRLVFQVPPGVTIPYTVAGLLDWSKLKLVVTPIGDVAKGESTATETQIREPRDTESTLQMPFRLQLSPTHNVHWLHASQAVSRDGRTELWHTRLANRDGDGNPVELTADAPGSLRAVWSPDYVPAGDLPAHGESGLEHPPEGPIIAAMDRADRHQVVVLTSAFAGYAKNAFEEYVPQPIDATLMMLSPLGGWLHSIGVWDPPFKASSLRRFPGNVFVGEVRGLLDRLDRGWLDVAVEPGAGPQALVQPGVDLGPLADRRRRLGLNIDRSLDFGGLVGSTFRRFRLGQKLDLSQWAHLAAQGRDHYVRIVYEGRLKKFGHRASLVKVTERRFEELNGEPFAWLRQYMYIVVRQPEIHYPDQGLAFGDRAMPLRRVRLTTLVTPHINNPYAPPANITSGSFWIMVDGKPFTFHGWAEDVGGNRLDFTTSFVFVPNSDSTGPSADDHFADIDTALANNPERTRVHVPGHKVTYAERAGAGLPPGGNDNTTYVTDSIDVANEYSARGDGAEAFFKPRITTAAVHLDAVEAVTGSTAPVDIGFTQQYLKGGFAAGGANEVFATLVAPSPTRFNPAQAGGVATPNLAITTLTRAIGPVAGALTDVVNDRFDPSSVFAMVDAVLFGKFPLQKLIVSGGSLGPDGPTLQVQRRNGPAGPEIVTELDWQPPVTKVDLGIVTFTPVPEEGQRLAVTATISTPLTGGEPITEIHGALGAFSITFFDSLVLNFDSFAFTSRTGQKTSVDVSLDQASPVEFRGDLAFVETLSSLLPPGAFGDGVSIDLIRNPLGVRAALDIGLPPATVGVFQLKNIAFSAGLTVPFLAGRPMVEFGFASREKPFLLAVLIFGGGGYFHVQVDTDGLKELEAAFEFGATAGLDIGVASGEVHIMAGIYFKMQRKVIAGGDPAGDIIAQLAGYLRCGGSLCVLGIVRISVEFCLSFTYYPAPLDKAKGRATLTVEVSIACFSKSVELTVERAFGGSSADPTFHDAMPNADLWATYADAFA